MSTASVEIRAALAARLPALTGIAGAPRTTPVPQLTTAQMPKLSIFILREQMIPDGDSNEGEARFIDDVTIGVSITRPGKPDDIDAAMDADVLAIEAVLTDPTFVTFGPSCLFESIEAIANARLFPQQGETYYGELRVEITFRTRLSFSPDVTDSFIFDLDLVQTISKVGNTDGHDLTLKIEPESDA